MNNNDLRKLVHNSRKSMSIASILNSKKPLTTKINLIAKMIPFFLASIGIFIFLFVLVIYFWNDHDIKQSDSNITIDNTTLSMPIKIGHMELTSKEYKKYLVKIPNPLYCIGKAIYLSSVTTIYFDINKNIGYNIDVVYSRLNIQSDVNIAIDNAISMTQTDFVTTQLNRSIQIAGFDINITDNVASAVVMLEKIDKILSVDIESTIAKLQKDYKLDAVDYYINMLKETRENGLDLLRRISIEKDNAKKEYEKQYALQQKSTEYLQQAISAVNEEAAMKYSNEYTQYAISVSKAVSSFKIYDRLYNDLSLRIQGIKIRLEEVHLKYLDMVM